MQQKLVKGGKKNYGPINNKVIYPFLFQMNSQILITDIA